MHNSEFDAFAKLLDTTCSLISRGKYTPSAEHTAMFFRALQAHDLASVRAAFDAHVRDEERGGFTPLPKDILAQLRAAAAKDGRPGPEEAWATACRAGDENATIAWTQEMAEAWAVAKPLIDARDKVGARMAFREAYERLVHAARLSGAPVNSWISLGHEPARRAVAVIEAQRLLGRPVHGELLEAPPELPVQAMPPRIRQILLRLRDGLTTPAEEEAVPAANGPAANPASLVDERLLPPGMRARSRA